MPSISLCMIVKNEAAVLPRALAYWRELADELIIVDTGSTDATVRIAEDHGAQVLHYAWEYPGNKGAARNVGVEAASGDWIIVLDADEVIRTDGAAMRAFLRDTHLTALQVLFENYPEGALTLRWYQVRVFRRGMYLYIHREHEMPHWCGEGEEMQGTVPGIIFEHRPPQGREPTKMPPTLERLHLDVTEHPGDPTPLYFLHRQYVLAGDWQQGIEWGLQYLMLGKGNPCEAYGNLATCFYQSGDAQESIRWLCRGLAEEPQRRIWWIRLAEIYLASGLHHLALAYLRGAATLPPVWEGQWEPETYTTQLESMIAQCEEAIGG